MKGKKKYVSIIISIYNTEKTLERCLKSISNLDYPNYEVILVYDNSNDKTLEIASKFNYKIICLKKKGGVAGARNAGVRVAKGDIIAITDADCEVESDWLTKLIQPFEDVNVGVVGGPDQAPNDDTFFAKCVDYAWTSFIGTGGMRRKGKIRAAKYYPRGCNIAIRRKIFDEIGYFNEKIVPGEEIEFDFRAKKKGYLLKYAPNALVWHRRRPTLKSFVKHLLGRGNYRVMLWKAHKELLEPLHVLPALFVFFILFLLILSFLSNFFLNLFYFIVVVYGVILFLAGSHSLIKIKDLRVLVVVPFIIFLQHMLYGLGFINGLIRNMNKQK